MFALAKNSHTGARSQTLRRAVWEQLIYLEHHSEPSGLFRRRQHHEEEEEEWEEEEAEGV